MRRRNNGYWHEGHLVTINCMRDYKKEMTSFYFIAERGDERKLIANTEEEILLKIEKRNKELYPKTYIDKRKNKFVLNYFKDVKASEKTLAYARKLAKGRKL